MNNSRNYAYFADLLPRNDDGERLAYELQAWAADYPELGLQVVTPSGATRRIRPHSGESSGD